MCYQRNINCKPSEQDEIDWAGVQATIIDTVTALLDRRFPVCWICDVTAQEYAHSTVISVHLAHHRDFLHASFENSYINIM